MLLTMYGHISHGKLARGNYDAEGHIGFRIAEPGVSNKLSEICFESFSSDSISGCRNRFPQYDSVPSDTKERTDHFAMPGSIESVRCLIKANDSIDRSFFINSNSCSSSSFAVPIFATSTNSRVSREEKLQCTGSVIKRSEGGNSVVDRKPDAVQRGSSNLTSPSIDHNFRCLSSELEGSLSGSSNRRPMDSRGTKTPYKYTGAEGSKIGYFNIYPYAPRSKVNSLTNGQYCGPVIYSQNGGNPQQRDLGLLATERDHNYCRVPTWGFESKSRFSVTVYEGLERMETKTADFSGNLQFKRDTRHRSLCISNLPPTSLLYFLETGPIQKGERCISKVMEIPKGICFSIFQPNWKSVKESSNGPGPALTGNSNLAKSVLVSPSSSDVSRQTNFYSTSKGSFNGSKDGKASINRERKIKTSGLDNFREKLFAEGILKNAAELITSAKRQGSITHYKSAWGKWDS